MRQYAIGQIVKERRGDRIGDIVSVSEDGKRLEIHVKNKRQSNLCLMEYEVEHYKGE